MDECKRVAILIDAENVYPTHAEQIFEKAESLGTIVHKEIYGAAAAINMWISPILKYVIHTNLSVRTTKGKNTSDIALAIGAMDILMEGNINYMIIVSSDSDFSTLAVRLRISNVIVVGMGSEAVNPLWKVACSEFVTLEHTDVDERPSLSDGDESSQDSSYTLLDAPSSAEERRSMIFSVIREQIDSNEGRISAPRLFLTLNNLPAYQVDKQSSGLKKAQQYLTAAFSDKIRMDVIDGTTWVSLIDSTGMTDQSDITVSSDEEPEQSSFVERMVADGIAEDTATIIEAIMHKSGKALQAYNQLRSQFGNALGTEYYHKARSVLAA